MLAHCHPAPQPSELKKIPMGAWMRDLSLKYKFWAVNAVSFFTTLLLVLYAMQLEQQELNRRPG